MVVETNENYLMFTSIFLVNSEAKLSPESDCWKSIWKFEGKKRQEKL